MTVQTRRTLFFSALILLSHVPTRAQETPEVIFDMDSVVHRPTEFTKPGTRRTSGRPVINS